MVFNIESILESFKHGNRHIKSWAHYTCQPPPEPLKTPQAKVQSCLSAEPCEKTFHSFIALRTFYKEGPISYLLWPVACNRRPKGRQHWEKKVSRQSLT